MINLDKISYGDWAKAKHLKSWGDSIDQRNADRPDSNPHPNPDGYMLYVAANPHRATSWQNEKAQDAIYKIVTRYCEMSRYRLTKKRLYEIAVFPKYWMDLLNEGDLEWIVNEHFDPTI